MKEKIEVKRRNLEVMKMLLTGQIDKVWELIF